MSKYTIIVTMVLASFISGIFLSASAQEVLTLSATLDSQTPEAKSIPDGAQYVDVARITLTASGGDVYLNGIELGTDVSGGLSNFINIFVYDTYDSSLLGTYPSQSINPNLIQFSHYVRIGSGQSKTYLVRVSLASSAAGKVRVGFSGFTFATLDSPVFSGVPVYSNIMTLPGVVATPTPTPTPTNTPTPTPTPSPSSGLPSVATPASNGFVSLEVLNLKEGDTISAVGSSDPDIYIANSYGYKRLFLNPVIFNFYSHLGGFAKVKNIASPTRDMLVTSSLFRDCEPGSVNNNGKVYGVEVNGEDTGKLHWINMSGSAAVAQDANFFNKVFCINDNEFNWYAKGADYTFANQVLNYNR